ncbi:uncharacterized protein LOC123676876 [Harmonia axyridis]|uniref:uncharacterized protein LOC123676876 n=1 Tax=Harmonia axyridis TaxID=115357 RepID=UPI001E27966D|nr:uncharacterized protein LOC123676876 [Harmonia axyridis]
MSQLTLKTNKCCVPNCGDMYSKRHRFPNPEKEPTIFKLWLEKVSNPLLNSRTPQQIRKTHLVCDRHFKDEVKVNSLKGIWATAIPELFLPESSNQGEDREVDEIEGMQLQSDAEREVSTEENREEQLENFKQPQKTSVINRKRYRGQQ